MHIPKVLLLPAFLVITFAGYAQVSADAVIDSLKKEFPSLKSKIAEDEAKLLADPGVIFSKQ